jgi:error-prone DNA polymerase
VDVNASDALATLEPGTAGELETAGPGGTSGPGIRLGLSSVRNLGSGQAELIAAGRPYADLDDFARRTRLPVAALESLAIAGAFGCFGISRRSALWAAGPLASTRPGQLPGTTPGLVAPPLPAMTPVEETLADLWATGASGTHPIAHIRPILAERGAVTTAALKAAAPGSAVPGSAVPAGSAVPGSAVPGSAVPGSAVPGSAVPGSAVPGSAVPGSAVPAGSTRPGSAAAVICGGLVTHRQRPPTAGGVVFINLEDETGMVNVICPPGVWARYRRIALDAAALLVHGRVECRDGAVNLIASRLERLRVAALASRATRSRHY